MSRAGALAAAGVLAALASRPAHAWELVLDAPASCATGDALRAKIDAQRTAQDPAVVLAVGIQGAARAWRAWVDVEEGGVAQGRRDIAGASCAEVVAAAALIGAMALDRAGESAPAALPSSQPASQPAAEVATLGGREVVMRPARPEPERVGPSPLDVTARVAIGVDAYGLPGPSPSGRLEVAAGRARTRIAFGLAWSMSTEDVDDDGIGVALGMVRFDMRVRLRVWRGLTVGAGVEIGRLSGHAIGIGDRSDRATAWWAALAELGYAIPIHPSADVVLTAEVAKPLKENVFLVDDEPRFRSGTTLRGYAGVAIRF